MSEREGHQIEFAIFCIENVAEALGVSGEVAYRKLARLSTFALTANFFRGETPRDGVFGRESSRIAFANAV